MVVGCVILQHFKCVGTFTAVCCEMSVTQTLLTPLSSCATGDLDVIVHHSDLEFTSNCICKYESIFFKELLRKKKF